MSGLSEQEREELARLVTGYDFLSGRYEPVPDDSWPRLRHASLRDAEPLIALVERILAARTEQARPEHVEVLPAESIALTVGLAQVLRGDAPDDNVSAMCVLALARLTGRHDWTDRADALEVQP